MAQVGDTKVCEVDSKEAYKILTVFEEHLNKIRSINITPCGAQ
jgi:hypothetical protein